MAHNEIVLGVTPTTSVVFNEEFPNLKKIDIEPYNITYSSWLAISLKLLLEAPRILNVIKKEHKQLESIIKEHKIDIVISDNRFGLYHKDVESIYITHQLSIQAGWLSTFANKIHHYYIKKFNRVWVPDFEEKENCLAGKLSKNNFLNKVEYIGALSRLVFKNQVAEDLDCLILLSGPEPQRTILELALLKICEKSSKQICMVRGTNISKTISVSKQIHIIDYASAKQLGDLMLRAKLIICRSGYSTLMDLHTLHKKKVILIPTPSQNEQEYLANYWEENYKSKVLLQRDIKNLNIDFLT